MKWRLVILSKKGGVLGQDVLKESMIDNWRKKKVHGMENAILSDDWNRFEKISTEVLDKKSLRYWIEYRG